MKNKFRSNIQNALIKDNDLTQKKICTGAKITEATLSNAMNNDDRIPQSKTIEKLKRYFEDNNMEWN